MAGDSVRSCTVCCCDAVGSHPEEALKLMQTAVTPPARRVDYHDSSEPVQMRVYKSLKLWSMYADLEEGIGTFEACKAVYDRIIDLRIATPQIVINFGMFLEENNYFEEAFKVRGDERHLFCALLVPCTCSTFVK